MADPKKRIYIISGRHTTDTRLVRAASPAQAARHVIQSLFDVAIASQDELVRYVRDIDVEEAGEEEAE